MQCCFFSKLESFNTAVPLRKQMIQIKSPTVSPQNQPSCNWPKQKLKCRPSQNILRYKKGQDVSSQFTCLGTWASSMHTDCMHLLSVAAFMLVYHASSLHMQQLPWQRSRKNRKQVVSSGWLSGMFTIPNTECGMPQ